MNLDFEVTPSDLPEAPKPPAPRSVGHKAGKTAEKAAHRDLKRAGGNAARKKPKRTKRLKGQKTPKGPDGRLAVNWDVIENEYIGGYLEPDPDSGLPRRVYPTLDNMAARHGINRSTLSYQSQQRNWSKRRAILKDKQRHTWDEELAKSRDALLTEGAVALDHYISNFGKAIAADAVPRQNVRDLEHALKLRAWIEDDKAGKGSTAGLELTELQQRYETTVRQAEQVDRLTAGIIPGRTEREAQDLRRAVPVTPLSKAWKRILARTRNAAPDPAPCDAGAFEAVHVPIESDPRQWYFLGQKANKARFTFSDAVTPAPCDVPAYSGSGSL